MAEGSAAQAARGRNYKEPRAAVCARLAARCASVCALVRRAAAVGNIINDRVLADRNSGKKRRCSRCFAKKCFTFRDSLRRMR